MSFLARAVAAREGAFFSERSKHAIARLRDKAAAQSSSPSTPDPATHFVGGDSEAVIADVLPEILQHSVPRCHGAQHQEFLRYYSPPSPFAAPPSSLASSLPSSAGPRKLPLHVDRLGSTGLNAFLPNLPQATFGPRRWRPEVDEVKMVASTANELRMADMPTIDEARAKVLMEGYTVVMKAFLIGTAIVVGGAAVAVGIVSSKLGIHSIDDIRTKGHQQMRPCVEAIRQTLEPLKRSVHRRGGHRDASDSGRRDDLSANLAKALGLQQSRKEGGKPLEADLSD